MSEYFPKPEFLGANVNFELDLSNYAAKADLKNAIGVDALSLAQKTDLANLISDVNKLDLHKLKNVPSGLSNLKNKLVKLDVDKLVSVSADLNKLSDKVKNDVVKNIEDRIPDITNLATYTTHNAKIK